MSYLRTNVEQKNLRKNLLLSENTASSTVSTTGFGFLTFDWVAPPVSDASMESDFLHSFDVLSKFIIQVVTGHLAVFSVFPVSLSVQEPSWDFEVLWVGHDGLDLFHFGFSQLTSSLGSVDFGFFQDQVGESSAHTSDGGQSVGDFDVTIDVGVLHSQNMLEILWVDEGHDVIFYFFFKLL